MRDAAGGHAERVARECVGLVEGAGIAGDHRVVVMRHTDEDTGRGACHGSGCAAGLLNGLPAGLQQHAVLRIHRDGLAFVDTEEIGIETGDVVDEGAPLRHRAARHTRLRVVQLVGIPTVGGNFGDHVVTAEQGLPQLVGRVDTAGKSARHADDSDGGQRGSAHVAHTSFFVNAVHDVSLPELPQALGWGSRHCVRHQLKVASAAVSITDLYRNCEAFLSAEKTRLGSVSPDLRTSALDTRCVCWRSGSTRPKIQRSFRAGAHEFKHYCTSKT